MAVLVFAENFEGKFKKSTFEAITYAYELSKKTGDTVTALSVGNIDDAVLNELGKYGAAKILKVVTNEVLTNKQYATLISTAAKQESASLLVLSNTFMGKSISPLVAIGLNASLATDVIDLPSNTSPFTIKRKVFSGKALGDLVLKNDCKVLAVAPNSYKTGQNEVSVTIESFNINIENDRLKHKEFAKTAGDKVSLTQAEIVVSAGRGLKGPENWKMVEDLAEILGAATACSKPVADVGWRPHHEHVGQTGIAIAPNLYIAIGISGAIQHLAGVNSSKVMVAINIDPEAPFFKAADYGIVGDAFEVVPKLIETLKEYKSSLN